MTVARLSPQREEAPAPEAEAASLRARVDELEARIVQNEQRRRAMIHIMADLATTNRRLAESRKAMLHILADYESDRSSLARQTERLDNSRRALLLFVTVCSRKPTISGYGKCGH